GKKTSLVLSAASETGNFLKNGLAQTVNAFAGYGRGWENFLRSDIKMSARDEIGFVGYGQCGPRRACQQQLTIFLREWAGAIEHDQSQIGFAQRLKRLAYPDALRFVAGAADARSINEPDRDSA